MNGYTWVAVTSGILGVAVFALVLFAPWSRLASGLRNWFIRVFIYYFVKVSHRHKCPGCGSRKWHKFVFSSIHQIDGVDSPGAILHQCSDCGAVYPEMTLRKAKEWAVDGVRLEEPDQKSPGLIPKSPPAYSYGVNREPTVIRPPGSVRSTDIMRDQSIPDVKRS
jgi:hypothetical protein